MKKSTKQSMRTVRLSGFGAALTIIAANLANAADPVPQQIKTQVLAATPLTVIIDKATLCKLGDQACMLDKPYIKALSGAQRKELKVLIGMNVQTDIKDACLIC